MFSDEILLRPIIIIIIIIISLSLSLFYHEDSNSSILDFHTHVLYQLSYYSLGIAWPIIYIITCNLSNGIYDKLQRDKINMTNTIAHHI